MRSFILFIFILCHQLGFAQGFQTVFPNLSGQELIDSVASHYRPAHVLDYANARDTLYAKILAADDDSLRCIYSGHTLYLDPTQDPTQYIYENGGTNGMNTEHAYPQAKGALQGTNAYSDMHHLYPTRIAVNEARADKPFAEIPDAQTQKWFRNNQMQSTIPTQHIEEYAESASASFEPREASKGDVARSVFYFYAVYRNQANSADPDFFNLQRPTLCQWTYQDPADSFELRKTWKIAAYQDGKPNPFVLDCTLAQRTWCQDVLNTCLSNTHEPALSGNLAAVLAPQPSAGQAQLLLDLPVSGQVQGKILDITGRVCAEFKGGNAEAGPFSIILDVTNLGGNGIWMGFVSVTLKSNSGELHKTIPMVVNH